MTKTEDHNTSQNHSQKDAQQGSQKDGHADKADSTSYATVELREDMNVTIKWIENMEFVAETGSGHALIVDGPPSIGGENLGPRPMELMLCGVGTCTAVDTVFILKKARQNVHDVRIKMAAERADTDPKVFTKIHLHFVIKGSKLNEKQVARAVDLSAEKYCSASLMLRATVDITHDYEIINEV